MQSVPFFFFTAKDAALRLAEFIELMSNDARAQPVVDCLRRELFFDETLDTDRGDARIITGARAEGEPIQDVGRFVDRGGEWRVERSVQRSRGRFADPSQHALSKTGA